MKHLRFLVLAAIMTVLPLEAFGFDLTLGVKGGGALPFYSGTDYQETLLDAAGRQTELRFGYSAGMFVTIGIVNFLAVQPEVLYSALGGNFGDSSQTFKENVTVLEIPVLLKARFRIGRLQLSPFAGPDLLIPIGEWSNKLIDDSTGDVLLSGTFDMNDIRNAIIGVVMGAGVLIPLGAVSVSLDARYHLGLQSMYTEAFDWDVRQNAVQLLVGIGYNVIR